MIPEMGLIYTVFIFREMFPTIPSVKVSSSMSHIIILFKKVNSSLLLYIILLNLLFHFSDIHLVRASVISHLVAMPIFYQIIYKDYCGILNRVELREHQIFRLW